MKCLVIVMLLQCKLLRGPSVGAEDCWGALEAYAKGADGYVEGIDGCAEGIDGCTEGIDGCIEGAEGAMGCVVKLVRAGVNLTVEDMDKIQRERSQCKRGPKGSREFLVVFTNKQKSP